MLNRYFVVCKQNFCERLNYHFNLILPLFLHSIKIVYYQLIQITDRLPAKTRMMLNIQFISNAIWHTLAPCSLLQSVACNVWFCFESKLGALFPCVTANNFVTYVFVSQYFKQYYLILFKYLNSQEQYFCDKHQRAVRQQQEMFS